MKQSARLSSRVHRQNDLPAGALSVTHQLARC